MSTDPVDELLELLKAGPVHVQKDPALKPFKDNKALEVALLEGVAKFNGLNVELTPAGRRQLNDKAALERRGLFKLFVGKR